MNAAIRMSSPTTRGYEEGTQAPLETLERKSGTCRDFALLFIEAVRSLGFGARFITGYLYDPALDGAQGAMQGSGATHAWAEVYLPGAGWVEYDPTNGLIAGENLIRVAVTRDPSQAIPISGTFAGTMRFQGITVGVTCTRARRRMPNRRPKHRAPPLQAPPAPRPIDIQPGATTPPVTRRNSHSPITCHGAKQSQENANSKDIQPARASRMQTKSG